MTESRTLSLNTSMNKGRSIETETRLQFEGRLAQLERDYILKTKHENILSVELWNLQTAHKQEIKDLKDEYDMEIDRKVKALQEDHFYKNNDLIRDITEQKKVLEEELRRLKIENQQLIEIREEQSKKMRSLREELDKSNISNRNELLKSQNEINESLTKVQSLYESETKRVQKKEEELKESIRRSTELEKQVTELSNHNKRIKQELAELLELQTSVREEISVREAKHKAISDESKEIQKKMELMSTENQVLDKKFTNLQEELKKRLKEKQEEIQVHKEDCDNKEQAINELRGVNDGLEKLIKEMSRKEKELKMEVSALESKNKSLNAKLTSQTLDYNLKIAEIGRSISIKVEGMRKEILNMKKNVKSELDMGSKVAQGNTNDIIKYYKDHISYFRAQKVKEHAAANEKFERELDDLKYRNEAYIKENKELSYDLETLNKHVVSTFDTLEEAKLVIKEYEAQLKNLKDDNHELKESNKQKAEKIKELQLFVDKEVSGLKQHVQSTLPEIIKLIESHYKIEVTKIIKDLDSFKDDRVIKMKQIKSYVAELQDAHEEAHEDFRQQYSEKIRRLMNEITESKMEYEDERNKVNDLKDELRRVKANYYNIDNENKALVAGYDKKLKEITEAVRTEKSDTTFEKNQSLKEMDRLRKELKDSRKETESKEDEIRSLKTIRLDMQECIIKYRNLLDRRQKDQENFDLKTQSSRLRDTDVDEIQGALKTRSPFRLSNKNSPF